ncbi:recombinase family protein [Alicyclobacillus curvatus]|jgi:site-specific DNA recombinase|nr:recombinase family protein [Alicyclobacillus curvatus]
MKIALYVRVSTDDQALHGFSIEGQMQRLEAYCTSQGWPNYEFYIDDGYSGTSMDRPQLKRLIRHIERGDIQMVIVYRLDRMSRRQRDLLFLIEDVFEPNATAFKSATEPFDTSTPLGKAMLGILGVFAQLERDTIIERTKVGLAQRARKGLWFGGPTPFGYLRDSDNDTLLPHPTQAPLVQRIFQKYLAGETLLGISNWLAENDSSRYVDHNFIKDMLERPVYAGLVKHRDDLFQATHEAIIDKNTWEAVQQEMKSRSEGRHPYGKYLLSGLAVCGVCGGNYKVQRRKHPRSDYVYHYYMCATKQLKGKSHCASSKQVKLEKLEDQVIEQVIDLPIERETLFAYMTADDDRADEGERIALQNELESITRKVDNLVNAVRDGVFTSRQIQSQMSQLEERQLQLEERLDSFVEKPEGNDTNVSAAIQSIRSSWNYMTDDERHQVLRTAVLRVVVHPDKKPDIIWNI